MNIDRLEKLIRLAGSDNDHEALLALRQALKMTRGDLWGAIHKPAQATRSAGSRDKQTKAEQAMDLARYLEKPGFLEIHYDVMLEDWIKRNGICPSRKDSDWVAVAELRERFEGTLGKAFRDFPFSTKRFSQAFSRCLGITPVKGGARRDLMGYRILMW